MDLDLRLIRYFTVVAQHGNFGRAATALHLAQPSLSRQIQRLEHQLGVRLLARTPRGTSLTSAGEAFLPRAHAVLEAADDAVSVARAADPPGEITIGYVEGLIVTPAVQALRHRHPDARVRTRLLRWHDVRALADGRVDALVTREPLSFSATVTPLYEEPRVLLVPATHRLAGKEAVSADDLGDEELVPCAVTPTLWSTPRDGAPPPAPDDSFEDKLELVASGSAVAVLPAGDHRLRLRDDVTAIPVEGFEPCRVVVASRAWDPNPLVAPFREAARLLVPAALGERGTT
ncbi:DNA-binding transcriptional regulator, LysR family [Amycolatopsis pretoriensis]|uniref:DNA-binding transcriptional regulator, LysR family n=1 Tax=Amycolatopsis pretoriensis TaxID=218821 RepID=A0A1H5Q5I8_9PSEU|nr:LysR family transcriptional regulator [Amycolatopsis pretoriensis]SEF20681.1 DNA-binding transcriptional regulator, LysR family [Amycolatopsis pretoriensis]